jgi:hypothetical protein
MDRDDKGRFLSENQAGRKAGTPNRSSAQIRDCFQMLLEENLEQLREDILSLEPKERVQLLLSLANYILPKLRSIDLKSDVEETITIDFNQEINWSSSDDINFEEN